MAIKPVKVKIVTMTNYLINKNDNLDYTDNVNFDDEIFSYETEMTDDEKPIVFETEGIMVSQKGLIKVIYDESGIIGVNNAETVFAFNEDTPTTVSMFKNGSLSAALVFDSEKKRQVCLYNNGPFLFEITVRTDILVNEITYDHGGKMSAEYTIEIKGIPTEYNRISVKITPID